MIENVHVVITKNARQGLVVESDINEVGSQYDNYAKQLVFTRPEEYEADNLILLFHNGTQGFVPVGIGTENVFAISNALTQTQSLHMQAAFERDGEILIHSNILKLTLRGSLSNGDFPVEAWPDPIKKLTSLAFCKAAYGDGMLSFYTCSGTPVQQITIAEDIQVGRVTAATIHPSDSASVRVEPAGRAFDFHFDIPQGIRGETGEKGDQGDKGDPGPQGSKGDKGDAGDCDISTHDSDSNAHSAEMAKKADKNGTLQTGLNAEQHNGWKRFYALEQLGIAPGTETIAQICAALPDQSILVFDKLASNASTAYPATAGILTITRVQRHQVELTFVHTSPTVPRSWFGGWQDGAGFSGWKEIAPTESGTWTPDLTDPNGGSPAGYTWQKGDWIRTGKRIDLWGRVEIKGKGSLDGILYIPLPSSLYCGNSSGIVPTGQLVLYPYTRTYTSAEQIELRILSNIIRPYFSGTLGGTSITASALSDTTTLLFKTSYLGV